MTTIIVDERWRLEPDTNGWVLFETRPGMTRPRDGSEPQPTTIEERYYYSRLVHAAKAIIDADPGESCADVRDLIAAIERQTDRIVAAVAS